MVQISGRTIISRKERRSEKLPSASDLSVELVSQSSSHRFQSLYRDTSLYRDQSMNKDLSLNRGRSVYGGPSMNRGPSLYRELFSYSSEKQ